MRSPETTSHRIITGVIWNLFGQLWLFILAFFSTPFIIHTLKADLFGIYTLSGVMIGYLAFLDLGLSVASVKYVAQYVAEKDYKKVTNIFWTLVIVYGLVGIMAISIVFIIAPFAAVHLLKIPTVLIPMAIKVIKLSAPGFLIAILLSHLNGVLRAVGRFDILNKITIGLGITQILVTVLLVYGAYSVPDIIILNLIVQIGGILVYWRYVSKLLPCLKTFSFSLGELKNLFRYGKFAAISGTIAPILQNIEKMFLITLFPVAALTYYVVPFALIDKLSVIRSSVASVLFPTFSYLQGTNSDANKELHGRSVRYILFLYSFPVVFLILFGEDFLRVWVGSDFARNSGRILQVLAVAGFVNALGAVSLVALQGLGKPSLPAYFHIIETIIYIPLSYVLISRWGGYGAALGWLVRVTLDTFLLQLAVCRFFKEVWLSWYRELFSQVWLPLSISCSSLFLVKLCGWGFIDIRTIVAGLVSLFVYAVVSWKWGLDDFARRKIIESLKSLRQGLP